MNKYILIILISFLSCSKQDKKTEIELMNCINNQYSDSIENFYGTKNKTSFYDLMLEVEEVLVKNELLRNTKKKSFLDFFSKLKDNNKKLALEKINKLLKESKFDMNYSNLYSIFHFFINLSNKTETKDLKLKLKNMIINDNHILEFKSNIRINKEEQDVLNKLTSELIKYNSKIDIKSNEELILHVEL